MYRGFMHMFPAPAIDASGGASNQIQLQGNLKDIKTKSVTQDGENGQKTNSVFVESAKVYATDDQNQNGKVNYDEAKNGQNGNVFTNAFNLSGDSVKNQAFSSLNDNAKNIANTNSKDTLKGITTQYKNIFNDFKVKVGGDKIKSQGASGVNQQDITSRTQSYDAQVKNEATRVAQEAQRTMLEAYQTALKQIAQEAAIEATKQEEQEAIEKDLQPKEQKDNEVKSQEGNKDLSLDPKLNSGLKGIDDIVKDTFNNPTVKPNEVKNESAKPENKEVFSRKISSGETLSKIAKENNTSVDEIMQINTEHGNVGKGKGILDKNHIYAGKDIYLRKT